MRNDSLVFIGQNTHKQVNKPGKKLYVKKKKDT